MRRFLPFASLVACLAAVPACRPVLVHNERSFELDAGDQYTIEIDPVSMSQKIKVKFDSPGAAVNVYVFLQKDKKEALNVIKSGNIAAPVLANIQKAEGGDLEAVIPANQMALVLFEAATPKHAKVKAKVSN